jgi:hypothetical protein
MRTAKGCPHGKGSFAVQDNTAHGIVTMHIYYFVESLCIEIYDVMVT